MLVVLVLLFWLFVFVLLSFRTLILYDIIVEHSFFTWAASQ